MSKPLVEVVIACHDLSRPIERAVASVLQDASVRERVRVIVVAHGLQAEPFEERLAGLDGHVRVVPYSDGIRSAAGPFNCGLDLVEAEYCGVMGSDDFLEPGAMAAWIAHVERERPDAAIARIRLQGEAVMPNPLVRIGRRRRLDATKDRLFYRTAPLGLIRTERMRELGLRMTEGVRVGEDFEFGIGLWALGGRIDFLRGMPCYVIGQDAKERTTLAPMSMSERLEPLVRLVDGGLPAQLSARHRRSLAIKLIRITMLGAAYALADTDICDADVEELARLLQRLSALEPRVMVPFNRADRRVLEGLISNPSVVRLRAEVARSRKAGRVDRWFTPNPIHSFDRESTLRRYVLYYLGREKGFKG